MANEKRLSKQEAIAKAEQELSTSRYIAECTRSPGMKAIHDKRCSWLSVIVRLAKKAVNVDAVEVVRCKDCKHRAIGDDVCIHPNRIGDGYIEVKDDDFCSYGERREGE